MLRARCRKPQRCSAYHIGPDRIESGPQATITPISDGDLCTLTWNSPWVGVENGSVTVTSAVPSAAITSGVYAVAGPTIPPPLPHVPA